MTTALLVVTTVLLTLAVILLTAYVSIISRRLNSTADEMEKTMRAVRERIVPLSDDTRELVANADGLVGDARTQIQRLDRLCESAEGLLEGKTIGDAAAKAASASKVTVLSVLEGVKQGLKVLRSAQAESKEELDNEQ